MKGLRAAFGVIVIASAAFSASALAEEKVSVQSLIGQGFQVVGTIPSQVGPGVFLQNKDKLFFCVVVETSTSADVGTRYCKPVH